MSDNSTYANSTYAEFTLVNHLGYRINRPIHIELINKQFQFPIRLDIIYYDLVVLLLLNIGLSRTIRRGMIRTEMADGTVDPDKDLCLTRDGGPDKLPDRDPSGVIAGLPTSPWS